MYLNLALYALIYLNKPHGLLCEWTRSRPLARSLRDLRLRQILFAVSQTAQMRELTRIFRSESVLDRFDFPSEAT
jgi:hypothetical protein